MTPALAPDPGRWRLLETLFYQASEMEERDRAAFLEHACGGDEMLRREVESLLSYTGNTLGFIQEPVAQAAREVSQHGDVIGSWRILEPLGDGGMGSVYLACRADQEYEQKVAIKLMRADLVRNKEMTRRFRRERQILAHLNHPNIARLLDGGVSAEGLPYLVMEYVEGLPLNEYCGRQQLPVKATLELFRTICGAVEYAHQRFVIHRDLKPANILVTTGGVAKLLDFGIARLLDPDLDGGTKTRASERLMTPEYASPEQIRCETVSAASDVYSMGALLYELLAKARPFRSKADNPLELAVAICEQTPPVPSAACSDAARAKQVRGDLDRIVMMAMRKEPERRYMSMAQLSADVGAYLAGYPLQARTDTIGYRASTFVRRHKTGVAAALLFVFALAGFGIAMGVLAQRAQRERETADREKQFLAGMFQAATPDVARGETITARMLLDRGAERIERELASQPRVRAPLLQTIAEAYRGLGLFDQAQTLGQKSYNLERQIFGEDSAEAERSLELLAELARDKGQYREAEPLLSQLIQEKRKAVGDSRPEIANLMGELGECYYWDAKDDEAITILRKTLAIDKKNGPDFGADTRNYLALALERKGDFEEPVRLLEEAVVISRRVKGPNSPAYATALHNLASTLIDRGDLKGAEEKLTETLEIKRRVFGTGHPDLLYTLNNLGYAFLEEGKWREAAPYVREALDNGLKRLGPEHPRLAGPMNNWARVLEAKGDYAEAEATYRHLLAIMAQAKASDTWPAAQITANLGLLYFDRGEYAAAEEQARKAMEKRRALGGEETPAFASSLLEVGEDRAFQGDLPRAELLLRQALAIREKRFPSGHPAIVGAQVRLGEILVAEGRASEAEGVLKNAVETVTHARFALASWQVAEAKNAYGVCLKALGHHAEGEALLRESKGLLVDEPRPIFRTDTVALLKKTN